MFLFSIEAETIQLQHHSAIVLSALNHTYPCHDWLYRLLIAEVLNRMSDEIVEVVGSDSDLEDGQYVDNLLLMVNKYECIIDQELTGAVQQLLCFHSLGGSTALSCMKWFHGHHFEIMTSNPLTQLSVNAYLPEKHSCHISPQSDLKLRSLRLVFFVKWCHVFHLESDIMSEIWLRQSMHIYSRNYQRKCHPDLIWSDGALGFFWRGRPNNS